MKTGRKTNEGNRQKQEERQTEEKKKPQKKRCFNIQSGSDKWKNVLIQQISKAVVRVHSATSTSND